MLECAMWGDSDVKMRDPRKQITFYWQMWGDNQTRFIDWCVETLFNFLLSNMRRQSLFVVKCHVRCEKATTIVGVCNRWFFDWDWVKVKSKRAFYFLYRSKIRGPILPPNMPNWDLGTKSAKSGGPSYHPIACSGMDFCTKSAKSGGPSYHPICQIGT